MPLVFLLFRRKKITFLKVLPLVLFYFLFPWLILHRNMFAGFSCYLLFQLDSQGVPKRCCCWSWITDSSLYCSSMPPLMLCDYWRLDLDCLSYEWLCHFIQCFQGRNADALALYFGEDPARCPFEQGELHFCPIAADHCWDFLCLMLALIWSTMLLACHMDLPIIKSLLCLNVTFKVYLLQQFFFRFFPWWIWSSMHVTGSHIAKFANFCENIFGIDPYFNWILHVFLRDFLELSIQFIMSNNYLLLKRMCLGC